MVVDDMRSRWLAVLVVVAMVAGTGSLAGTTVTKAVGTAAEEGSSCQGNGVSLIFDHVYDRFWLEVDGPCRVASFGNLAVDTDPSRWASHCQTPEDGTITCEVTYGDAPRVAFELGPQGAFTLLIEDETDSRLTGDLVRIDA